jgi:hypothetical protein
MAVMAVRETPATPRRRGRNGAGSIHWHKAKGCYIGSISLGKRPDGGRIRPEIRGHSIAEVSAKLDALRRDFDNGIGRQVHRR